MKNDEALRIDGKTIKEWEPGWKPVPDGLKCHQPDLNSVVGLYRYLLDLEVVALGTGIDMGGGIAKRLSDFIRQGDSGRDHHTGRLIYENRHLLKVEVLITGSGRRGQAIALQLLNPMLELHRPIWTVPARCRPAINRPSRGKPRRTGPNTKMSPYTGPVPSLAPPSEIRENPA